MAGSKQKLKLLYLMKILDEETDSDQGLTMTQILERLEELEITAERKSVYRDIESLREFGLDIRTCRRAGTVEYALANRDFDLPQLMLLIDAVQSSRFLTARKADSLVRGLKKLASARQRRLLDRSIHVDGRIKSQNESVFSNVDLIQSAIRSRRKVTFRYFKYDVALQKRVQHDGERYVESPVKLVYSDGFYYMVSYNERHDSFPVYRVDRMDDIAVTEERIPRNEKIAAYDASKLEENAFSMYSGDPSTVVFLVEEEAMGAIVDRFGKDVKSVPVDDNHARVFASVIVSPAFYGWLAQFGTRIVVEKPSGVAESYREYLEEIASAYK